MDQTASPSNPKSSQRFGLLRLAGPELDLPVIDRDSWLLGRAPDCDLVLAHSAVSRHHARLDLVRGQIEDLDSSGGTRVNAVPIKHQSLKSGDRIQIGPWQFALTSPADTAVGATLQRAALSQALAAPRLDLLLSFCETINKATDDTDIHLALAKVAMAGSGCQRAVVIDLTEPDLPVLAQAAARPAPFHASRQLVEASKTGEVIQLSQLAIDERSASIQTRRLVSATAVALVQDGNPVACLYLDAREDENVEMPDTARFCLALARMTELALARLHQQRELWRQREQIYADLHDDLGARLLSQVYRAPDAASADEARAMLDDLRDVVSRPARGQLALDDLLAQMRVECSRRLALAQVELCWTLSPLPGNPTWSNRAAALLSRCLREAISNALRHAEPGRITVDIQARDGCLDVSVRHDGCFQEPGLWTRGRGTRSLISRAESLGGDISWLQADGELETRLIVALEPST